MGDKLISGWGDALRWKCKCKGPGGRTLFEQRQEIIEERKKETSVWRRPETRGNQTTWGLVGHCEDLHFI